VDTDDLKLPDNNPKSKFGAKKPNLFLVPAVATLHMADAMGDGARKYGPYNWRENSVAVSVYIAAAKRHMDEWVEGEGCADDSGVHHLGHAAACLAILLDAEAFGNLVDDRPLASPYTAILKSLTKESL
jgi:hypothetical protein